jgi:acyl CoA:acetate/3-ketoacid CoA transferase
MRRIVAPNAIIIMDMERNNKVKPNANLLGREWLKPTYPNDDVGIVRNTTADVKANKIASMSAAVKTTKKGL